MVFQFKFPDVGEGITEGEIVSWKVKLGDIVKADEVLCEVETDKSVVEVPSPKAGKIVKMNGKEGEVINVGDVLVEIDETGKGEIEAPPPAEKTIAEPPAPEEQPKEIPKEEPAEKPKGASVVGVLEEAPDEEVKETKKRTS